MTVSPTADAHAPADHANLRYRVADLLIDIGRQRVTRADVDIALPKLSFDLLVTLARAAPNLVSGDRLIEQVWPKAVVSPETLSQRVKLLRDALGDDPHRPRYVEGLRGRGYRLVPPVEAQPVDMRTEAATIVAKPTVTVADSPTNPIPWFRRRGFLFAAGFSVVSCAVLTLGFLVVHHIRSEPVGPRIADSLVAPTAQSRAIAVLPFENLGMAADAGVALAVSDAVQHRLASASHLRVVARSAAHALGRRNPDAREAGRLLGVRYLVEGRVQRDGKLVRVTVELIDARTSHVLRSIQIDRGIDALFEFQDRIAEEIVREFDPLLGGRPIT